MVIAKILFFLTVFGTQPVHTFAASQSMNIARGGQIAPLQSDLQRACEKHLRSFLKQTDERYVDYQVKNGGICGPTCVIDIITAQEIRDGELPHKRTKVLSMIDRYYRIFAKSNVENMNDIRYGTQSGEL